MNTYPFKLAEWGPLMAEMPDAEDLALRRMIDAYFEREGPLPRDRKLLQDLIRLDWDCISPVLEKFFDVTDHGYVQAELQEEVERQQRRQRVAAVNGSRGGRPRRV
jgi:uncharacterized protein YdaU (DUF1376 family)